MSKAVAQLERCSECGEMPMLACYDVGWFVRCKCGQEVAGYNGSLKKREAEAIWNYVQRRKNKRKDVNKVFARLEERL